MHLEDCLSGRVDEAHAVNVKTSSKSDVEDLVASGKVLEQDKKSNIEEEMKANVPTTKSTYNGEASKFDTNKKTITKPPPTL